MKSDGQSQANHVCNNTLNHWSIGQCMRLIWMSRNYGFHFGHLSICDANTHVLSCRHAFGQSDALAHCEHLLIEVALVEKKTNKILRSLLTCRHKCTQEKKRTHEFMYYCSIFYALQFMACYLSSAGTIFAFGLSCLYLCFGQSVETRDTRSAINVTSQCTRICQPRFVRLVCIYPCAFSLLCNSKSVCAWLR